MDKKKWEEIINQIRNATRKEDIDVRRDFEQIITCVFSNMAQVYDYVLNGWVEYEKDIAVKLGVVTVSVVLLADEWNGFIGVDVVNALWRDNLSKEFSEKKFQCSYLEFCYDLGMLSSSWVETRVVNKEAQFIFIDLIDIVSKFMTQEEFYNLMMGIGGGGTE